MSISLQWRLLAVIGLTAACFAVVASFIYYSVQRDHYLNGVDAKLTTGAKMARHHVGPDFHDGLVDADSLDPASYEALVAHFNAVSVDAGFQYLWSNLFLPDGRIVFTTATSPGKDVSDQDHASFFSVHSDPSAFASVVQSGRPSFTTFKNEWGEGRMVLLPYRDAHDRLYVFGASMDVEPIERFLVGKLGSAAAMFLGLLVVTSLIAGRISRSLTRPLRELQHTAESIAHGDYATPKVRGGGAEIEALSASVELMRETIQRSLNNLQESELRFKTLFDQSPVSVLLHDKDTGAVIDANQPAWQAYGVDSLDELKALDIWLEPPFSKADALANIQQAVKCGGHSFVWKSLNKNGDVFWEQVVLRPVVINGVECILSVAVDITERKQIQLELEQHRLHLSELVEIRTSELELARQAAESASRAKSVFLANMSHEIRTPLNAVIGFAQILRHDAQLSVQQREQVETIARGGQHLLGLINDILDLSKIEAGRLPVRAADFNLLALLHDLRDLFSLKAVAKGLHLDLRCDDDLPVYVHGDEGKLRQVLINLLGNAVKFTETGKVRLVVRHVSGASEPSESASEQNAVILSFEIEDTGPGMTQAELAMLFQPFQQASAGQKSGGGTGLGLSICQKLVHLMGGEIEVSSTVDRGSCFSFVIPLSLASDGVASASDSLPAVLQWQLAETLDAPCLLVVDDVADNRKLLLDLLKPLGFRVEEACNGIEAVEAFENHGVALVLMDMRMPVMDGYEATRRIKVLSPQIPVVAVTASALDDDQKMIRDCGVDAFVSKPVDRNELLKTIWRLLELPDPLSEPVVQAASSAACLKAVVVRSLQAGLRARMREVLSMGDIETFELLLNQSEHEAPEVINCLRTLANDFEYDRLQVLLADSTEEGVQ